MSASNLLATALLWVHDRFSGRKDGEREQAFVRLVLGVAISVYFVVFYARTIFESELSRVGYASLASIYLVASALMLIDTVRQPGVSIVRRIFGSVLDMGTITFLFLASSEHALPFYFLYLWVIFGNGIRYGQAYLLGTLTLALTGFGAAMIFMPYWVEHRQLGIGLWLGTLALSLYVNILVGRLNAALESAESANQAKRHFISSVSHELRTPLNAIIGMTRLLQITTLNREQDEMVRSIDNASRVMLSLIEDVLDFSKIEAGKILIDQTNFDLQQLVDSTINIFRYQAAERKLQLRTWCEADVPVDLRGDPHKLRQVLVNLFSNAIKFTETGGIVLRILLLSETAETATLRFEVQDTGIGISEEAQTIIFESFAQADVSIARRYGGTGLGTTILRHLVELMGGRVGLDSALGVGSTFWFDLEFQKQAPLPEPWQLPGLRVLLVGFPEEHRGEQVEGLASKWGARVERLRDIDEIQRALIDAECVGERFHAILLGPDFATNDELQANEHGSALRQKVVHLQAFAKYPPAVVLFVVDALERRQLRQLTEASMLAAVLPLDLGAQALFNVLRGVRLDQQAIAERTASEQFERNGNQDGPRDAASDVEAPLGFHHPGVSRYNILVAEDNPTNGKVIQKVLEHAGHICTLVQNGEEALDRLGSQDFDAVVLDMNMPVMNGPEAAKAYRFMRPDDLRAPIIMLSANLSVDARQDCIDCGVDEFISKPIQIVPFLSLLERLVQKFGSDHSDRLPFRQGAVPPLLFQPACEPPVLNYATLAELESISQDPCFVNGLLEGFIHDNQVLLDRLAIALHGHRFEECKDILHAMKGASIGIGAMALKMTCQRFEKLTHGELRRDAGLITETMRGAFSELERALASYRKERDQLLLQKS